MINAIVNNTSTALNSSLAGISRNQDRFHNAALDVVNGFSAAANSVSAQHKDGLELTSETFLATNEAVQDPTYGMIDMITSQRAFEASLEAFKTAAEMEESVVDILG